MSNRRFAIWSVALVLVALLAFVLGRSLRPEASAAVSAFDVDAAPYAAVGTAAGLTMGGFSGFSERGGLDGRTTIAGRVLSIGADQVVIDTAAGPSALRLSGDRPLRQVAASSAAAIRSGVTVAVRLSEPGGSEAAAILVLSGPQ